MPAFETISTPRSDKVRESPWRCDDDGPQSHPESVAVQGDDRRGGRPPQAGIRQPGGPPPRPLPAPRRFPLGRPIEIPARIPLAPASGNRDDHLRSPGRRGTWGQHGKPGRHHPGRRPVDDRGQRHRSPGDAQRRRPGSYGGIPALGQPALLPQDDGSQVPGCEANAKFPKSPWRAARR